VYSLGVLLYELLTSTLPFDPREMRRRTYSQIQHQILEVDPPKPSTRIGGLKGDESSRVAKRHGAEMRAIVKELRGDLDAITLRAMEKDRNRRYETASALAMDVQRYLEQEPVVARPQSVTYQIGKFARRNRAMVTAVVATFAAAVALTAAAFTMLNRKVTETTAAKEHAELAQAKAEQDNARVGALLSTLGTTTSATMIVDIQTKRIVDANEECLQLFGYTREEFVGLGVLAISAEPESTAAAFRRIAEGELRTVERPFYRRNGETFRATVFAGKFSRDGHDYAIGEIVPLAASKPAGKPATGGAD
jgi:PAS domain S-box-containing protein